jgi:hypothetical protein
VICPDAILPRLWLIYWISDEARMVLAQRPERIDMQFLERYASYVEWRQRSVGIKPID